MMLCKMKLQGRLSPAPSLMGILQTAILKSARGSTAATAPLRSCWRRCSLVQLQSHAQLLAQCSLVQLQSHTQLLTQVQIRNMSILTQSRTVKDKVSKRGTNGHLWHSKAYTKCMSSACIGQCACNGATYFLMVLNAL